MNKLRTVTDICEVLDEDFAWRIKELSVIKTTLMSSSSVERSILLRAAVAILYAHWEGFVKNSARAYLNFINCQGIKYKDSENCFLFLGLKKEIMDITKTKNTELGSKTLSIIQSKMYEDVNIDYKRRIVTSNLMSSVFDNILYSLNIDRVNYETKYNLIDEVLLKKRNKIAHGNHELIQKEEYFNLCKEILTLMRQFKNDVLNGATLEQYRIKGDRHL